MSVSAFGVEHLQQLELLGKRDRSAELGAGATASAAGAVLAHKAHGDLRRAAPARRVGGVLNAIVTGDPDKLAAHLRGGVGDAKKLGALRYARTGLGIGAAGLAGTAILQRSRRAKVPGQAP